MALSLALPVAPPPDVGGRRVAGAVARLAPEEPGRPGATERAESGEQVGMGDDELDVAAAYRLHGRDLFGFAVNATQDRHLAEECVQDTFTRAWQARARFDPARGSLRTWLFAIARNVVVDHVRARRRRPLRAVGDDELARVPDETDQPERLDAHLTLLWALAQISEPQRRVVVAVRLEGLTYEQLAERDGVPVPTLRTRMFHALRALRAILEEEEGDA